MVVPAEVVRQAGHAQERCVDDFGALFGSIPSGGLDCLFVHRRGLCEKLGAHHGAAATFRSDRTTPGPIVLAPLLHFSVAKRLPTPYDMFPDSYGRHIFPTPPFPARTLSFLWSNRA